MSIFYDYQGKEKREREREERERQTVKKRNTVAGKTEKNSRVNA